MPKSSFVIVAYHGEVKYYLNTNDIFVSDITNLKEFEDKSVAMRYLWDKSDKIVAWGSNWSYNVVPTPQKESN